MINILNVEAIMIHSGGHWNNWNPKEKTGKANKTPSAVSNKGGCGMHSPSQCVSTHTVTFGN